MKTVIAFIAGFVLCDGQPGFCVILVGLIIFGVFDEGSKK